MILQTSKLDWREAFKRENLLCISLVIFLVCRIQGIQYKKNILDKIAYFMKPICPNWTETYFLWSKLSRREQVLHHIRRNELLTVVSHWIAITGSFKGQHFRPSLTSCLPSFSLRQTPSKPPSTTSSPSYLSTCSSSFRGLPTLTSSSCWCSR